MPLPAPILDDRSYQQLRDELVRRIPVYTPEWTDHNGSDPGITLLELVAFLSENLLFRFNQLPDLTKLAYLRLLRLPLRPAAAARALIALSNGEAVGTLVPQFSELKAGDVSFETQTEVTVWPVSALTVGKIRAAAPDREKEPEAAEFVLRAIDALGGLGNREPIYYQNQVVSADGSTPPVDCSAAVDGMLWIAVLKDKLAIPSTVPEVTLNIGFVPDREVPDLSQVAACPGAGAVTPAPPVEWQISTGKLAADGSPLYRKIELAGDTTRGLSQQGVVRLRLPGPPSAFGLFPAADADLGGAGDRPPALDEKTEANILFWLRAFRSDNSRLGKVLLVAVNAAEVTQTRPGGPEYLGTGNAQPDQTLRLLHRPVIDGSLVVEVEEAGAWRRWTPVDGFHASRPDDRHYVLDLEAGEISFGNGIQGLPPQIGQRIRAVSYRYGGGAEGNVPPGAISKLPRFASLKASNPLAAFGGSPAETIEQALDRIPGELRRRDRAVTAGDFQELALATPGAALGRAECLPRFHPPTRTTERPGIVSVVVWPAEDKVNPNAPMPDRNLLRAVCEWLDKRRLVTTELYVIPPTYRKVAVAVGLRVKPGYGVDAVRRWVELVLRQYLAPLPPYGPDGKGWPLGRRVYGPELEAAALQVEGVEFLEGLSVAGWNAAVNAWTPGTVELAVYESPELAEITVVEGPPLEPGKAVTPLPPAGVLVPIPVIREEC
jgi:hypothetical protein